MKLNYACIFSIILSLVAGKCMAQQADILHRIDSMMSAANRTGVFNGVVLVAKDQHVIYQKAFGYADAGKNRQLTTNMRFDIGSISKEFNSIGIMRLCDEGKLKLEDSISKYLSGLPAWAATIHISNLLNYTSGLPQTNASSEAQYLKEADSLPKLTFQPGTAYIYSNANIFLQQLIIEKVSGMSYADFVKRRLLAPLKLQSIAIDSFKKVSSIARPFDNDFKETPYLDKNTGLLVTADELYRWAVAIENGKVVSPAAMGILAKSFDNNECSLGAAKITSGRLVLHVHQGSGYNYECLLYQQELPAIIVILLTNNQNFKVNDLKDAVVNILQNQPYQVPKRSIYLDLRTRVLADFDKGIAFYEQIKVTGRDRYDFRQPEVDLYSTAKYLMRRSRYDDAIRILDLSTLENLRNTGGISYAFSLVGECYRKKNEPEMALIYYRKAVELDPSNQNAAGMVKELTHPGNEP